MANTYTQMLVHLVFAVKNRRALISKDMRPDLERYISGVIANRKHKLLSQYAMPDHMHILIGLNPNDSISNLVRDIKSNSSKWVKVNKKTRFKFEWQKGFGAFTHNRSDMDTVIKYILNQPQHHKSYNFFEEYKEILDRCKIDFDNNYLFDQI